MLVGLKLNAAPSVQLIEPDQDVPPASFSTPADPGSSLYAPPERIASNAKATAPSLRSELLRCKQEPKKEKPQKKKAVPNPGYRCVTSVEAPLVEAFAAVDINESRIFTLDDPPEDINESQMFTLDEDAASEANSGSGKANSVGSGKRKDWRHLVAEQWKIVRSGKDDKKEDADEIAKEDAIKAANVGKQEEQVTNKKTGFFRGLMSSKNSNTKTETADDKVEKEKTGNSNAANLIPQTFEDMARFNAMMVGSNMSWIGIVIDAFDRLVASVVNREERRLEKESRILALRIHREAQGTVFLNEYKVCMLAGLRSLLPKQWDLESEAAWAALWETVQRHLEPMLTLPARFEKPVEKFLSSLDASEMRAIGMAVFERMFKVEPKSEMYFLQSNDRLCFIVQRAFGFSSEVYQEPGKTVDAITYLGLKHIMYGIPEEYFQPFVTCCLEELSTRSEDPNVLEGFEWSMRLVQSIMVQAIEDGSNPLLRAVLKNDPKQVRKELAKMPRGQRAAAALGGM